MTSADSFARFPSVNAFFPLFFRFAHSSTSVCFCKERGILRILPDDGAANNAVNLVWQFLSHRWKHYYIYIKCHREHFVPSRPQRNSCLRRTAVLAFLLWFQELFQCPFVTSAVSFSFAVRLFYNYFISIRNGPLLCMQGHDYI